MSPRKKIDHIVDKIKSLKLQPHVSQGVQRTIITVIGDEDVLREQPLEALAGVESVKSILKPYKLVSRETHPDRTIIKVDNIEIGGKNIVVIAGPCSVEGEKEVIEHALMVKKAGASIFRAGAYKPRTSPYSFQGFGGKGPEVPREREKGIGSSHSDRGHGPAGRGRRRGTRRHTADRHAQHAELQPAQGGRQDRQAGAPEARDERHGQRVPHVGGVHPLEREQEGHPLSRAASGRSKTSRAIRSTRAWSPS